MKGHLAARSALQTRRKRLLRRQPTIPTGAPPVRLFLVGLCLVLLAIPLWAGAPESASPSTGEGAETASFADHLFAKFQHPRCMNCHQFNSPTGMGSQPLPGEPATSPPHKELSGGDCLACHTQAVTGIPEDVKPSERWHAPGRDMDWTGLTARETCEMIKQANQGAFTDPAAMEEHLQEDWLIRWAITRGRVPPTGNPQVRERVPGGRPEWRTQVNAWMQGGMRCE